MQQLIVAISGSPSTTSRTALLAEHVLALSTDERPGRHYRVSAIPPAALLNADMGDERLAEMVEAVTRAHGLIIATPIYKAAYSGLLKAFLDVLPQFALAGTAVLPVATGGSLAHVLALDYALRPVLQSMGARHIVQAHFVPEAGMAVENGLLHLSGDTTGSLHEAVRHFRYAVTSSPEARHLGHPHPPHPALPD